MFMMCSLICVASSCLYCGSPTYIVPTKAMCIRQLANQSVSLQSIIVLYAIVVGNIVCIIALIPWYSCCRLKWTSPGVLLPSLQEKKKNSLFNLYLLYSLHYKSGHPRQWRSSKGCKSMQRADETIGGFTHLKDQQFLLVRWHYCWSMQTKD